MRLHLASENDDQKRGLAGKIEFYHQNYQSITGRKWEHFFCPILLAALPGELIRGHIVSESLGGREWVPQRADVDHFYGSVVEADVCALARDRGKDLPQLWLDRDSNRDHQPRLIVGGKTIDHYFTDGKGPVPKGFTPAEVVDGSNNLLAHIVLKSSFQDLQALSGTVSIEIGRDYSPAVVAAMLKAAHLTLFSIAGYRHVFSGGGLLVADILRRFFTKHGGSHSVTERDIAEHFDECRPMVAPVVCRGGISLSGSVVDSLFLTLLTGRDVPFALGVVAPVAEMRFCIFFPTEIGTTIDTYLSFLSVPPPFVRARLTRFDAENQVWEVDAKDWIVPMNQPVA